MKIALGSFTLCLRWKGASKKLDMPTKAVIKRCSVNNVFLKIPENLQENSGVDVFFLIKLPGGCKTLFPQLCIPFHDTCFSRFPHSVCALKWWLSFSKFKILTATQLAQTFQLRVFHRYLVCIMVSSKKHLMKSGINAALHSAKIRRLNFFCISVFFHRHWRFTVQQEKGGEYHLFHSTTSTHSRTLRHLFATLHVRWLSHIFNRNACVYQTAATRWDLPSYRIIIWLIDWWCNVCVFVCLPDELILHFCYNDLTWETNGFKLASTITVVLQANRLTKCASHGSKSERWWWYCDCFLPNYKSARLKYKSEVVYIFIPNIWLNLFLKTQDIKLYLDKYQT